MIAVFRVACATRGNDQAVPRKADYFTIGIINPEFHDPIWIARQLKQPLRQYVLFVFLFWRMTTKDADSVLPQGRRVGCHAHANFTPTASPGARPAGAGGRSPSP